MGSGQPLLFDSSLRQTIQRNLQQFERLRAADESLTPAAVAFAIVGTEGGQAAIIVTRRTSKLRTHRGQWAIPGGRVEPGESAEETALREMQEEVGLQLSASSLLGFLDEFPTRSGFSITPAIFWGVENPRLDPNPREVASAHILPLHWLNAPGIPEVHPAREGERPLISLSLEALGSTIWAPTAALIYQLREVALEGQATRVRHFEQPQFAWR